LNRVARQLAAIAGTVAGAAAAAFAWRMLTGWRAHPLVPREHHLARRTGALETHLADLEERIGPVVSWFDDDRPCGQRR
jgi:hypothetical protein